MKNRVGVGTIGALLVTLGLPAAEPRTTTVPTAAQAADADIRRMDMDRDGKISATEHTNGAKRMFGKVDADGNGLVTSAEMNAAQPVPPGSAPREATGSEDMIKSVDTNKDGSLSPDENAAGSRTMFQKMDLDHDGFLTAAEVQRGYETLMKPKKN